MKLATLETTNGLTIAGVDLTEDSPRYLDLRAIDDTLPRSLKALLASEDGIAHAANAIRDGLKKNNTSKANYTRQLHPPEKSSASV